MKINIFFIYTLLLLISLANCQPSGEQKKQKTVQNHHSTLDKHSLSKPNEAITEHLDLDLTVDFTEKTLTGIAKYDIRSFGASEIVIDTKDLIISKVHTNKGVSTDYHLSESTPYLGSALHIPIDEDITQITIYYKTSKDAAALLWLDPEQTTDKNHPFLFTQGQAILTRTWLPCQDSPGVRISYNATVRVPSEMLAVMSASNPKKKNKSGIYHFEMKQAIPPYLIALAVGDLEFGKVGDRTGVYAEPSMLEKSLYEFEDMEKMLIVAEELYGPYLWEQYDVIVLPASFPFGGMENPRLTFATPTIIAGDKSLTALIAHELAHSWSGNLVTNATWNDFWLNEGFTVYFERRIMESLYGEDYANMLALLGYQDLEHEVTDIGHSHADTHLRLDLDGRDPDDGMTDIAYEKGAFFLTMLESKFGRERFDRFLKEYFDTHKFQSMTTDRFITYLQENLLNELEEEIDIKEWIDSPGIPDNVIKPQSDKFSKVEESIQKFTSKDDLSDHEWSTHEWLHFIRQLPQNLSMEKMKELDNTYAFSDSGNSEIAAAWYELSINSGYNKINDSQIEVFLTTVGRRKFLTPLYRAMKENDQIDRATEIYKKARKNYHAVSRQTLDELLSYNS